MVTLFSEYALSAGDLPVSVNELSVEHTGVKALNDTDGNGLTVTVTIDELLLHDPLVT